MSQFKQFVTLINDRKIKLKPSDYPVYDLCGDVLMDTKWPYNSQKAQREHLETMRACDGAIDAHERCRELFSVYRLHNRVYTE